MNEGSVIMLNLVPMTWYLLAYICRVHVYIYIYVYWCTWLNKRENQRLVWNCMVSVFGKNQHPPVHFGYGFHGGQVTIIFNTVLNCIIPWNWQVIFIRINGIWIVRIYISPYSPSTNKVIANELNTFVLNKINFYPITSPKWDAVYHRDQRCEQEGNTKSKKNTATFHA